MPMDSPLSPRTTPTAALAKTMLSKWVRLQLEDGFEVRPQLLLGWSQRGLLAQLPPVSSLLGPIILALAKTLQPDAVGLAFSAWATADLSVAPEHADDRKSVVWVSLLDRKSLATEGFAWAYNFDYSRPPGTPGHIIDIRPEDHTQLRSATRHLQVLLEHWRSEADAGSDPRDALDLGS